PRTRSRPSSGGPTSCAARRSNANGARTETGPPCAGAASRCPGWEWSSSSAITLILRAASTSAARPATAHSRALSAFRIAKASAPSPRARIACGKMPANGGAAMEKPRLGFWQVWNMSFGFLGIQFGWGLQMANMSAIYEYLGARPDQIAKLWLAAPMNGLLVQPIIGAMSDRTWCRLGRRRPYFLAGAILSSLALI